jgi:hypothetical protein
VPERKLNEFRGRVPGTVYLIHAAIKSRVSGSGLVITRVNARSDSTLRDAAASSIPGSTAHPVEYPAGVPGSSGDSLLNSRTKKRIKNAGFVVRSCNHPCVNARPDCTLRDAAASSISGSAANPVEYPTRNARRLVPRGMRSAQGTRLSRRCLPPGAVPRDRIPCRTGHACLHCHHAPSHRSQG